MNLTVFYGRMPNTISYIPNRWRCPQVQAACQWDLNRALQALEQRLGNQPYVMGEELTVPDLILGHCAGWMQRSGFEAPTGKVADYFTRLHHRPAFHKAQQIRNAH